MAQIDIFRRTGEERFSSWLRNIRERDRLAVVNAFGGAFYSALNSTPTLFRMFTKIYNGEGLQTAGDVEKRRDEIIRILQQKEDNRYVYIAIDQILLLDPEEAKVYALDEPSSFQPELGERERQLDRAFLIRDNGLRIDWRAKFGTEEMFTYLRDEVLHGKAGVRFEKHVMIEDTGEHIMVYSYRMPLDILIALTMLETKEQFRKLRENLADHFRSQYLVDPSPEIAFSVRDVNAPLEMDYGPTAIEMGWTAYTADIVEAKPNGNTQPSVVEDLIGCRSRRGHGVVFELPSPWFQGATNPRLHVGELAQMAPHLARGSNSAREFYANTFNSGQAAFMTEDILKILGIILENEEMTDADTERILAQQFQDFSGHSRGGEIALLLSAKFPLVTCEALTPASGLSIELQHSSEMRLMFSLLHLLTIVGNIRAFERTIATELTPLLVWLLVRDGVLVDPPEGMDFQLHTEKRNNQTVLSLKLTANGAGPSEHNASWIITKNQRTHQASVDRSDPRAAQWVILELGNGNRGRWKERDWKGLPPGVTLGEHDRLSQLPTVMEYLDNQYDRFEGYVSSWAFPGTAAEVTEELRRQLTFLVDNGGHYSWMHPTIRMEILNRKWDTIDKIRVTQDDLTLTRTVRDALRDRHGISIVVIPQAHRSQYPSLSEQMESWGEGKKHTLLVDYYEFVRLQRASYILGESRPVTDAAVDSIPNIVVESGAFLSPLSRTEDILDKLVQASQCLETPCGHRLEHTMNELAPIFSSFFRRVEGKHMSVSEETLGSLHTVYYVYLMAQRIHERMEGRRLQTSNFDTFVRNQSLRDQILTAMSEGTEKKLREALIKWFGMLDQYVGAEVLIRNLEVRPAARTPNTSLTKRDLETFVLQHMNIEDPKASLPEGFFSYPPRWLNATEILVEHEMKPLRLDRAAFLRSSGVHLARMIHHRALALKYNRAVDESIEREGYDHVLDLIQDPRFRKHMENPDIHGRMEQELRSFVEVKAKELVQEMGV